eukprot:5547002-Pleurochrysis_carterae.AAC.4
MQPDAPAVTAETPAPAPPCSLTISLWPWRPRRPPPPPCSLTLQLWPQRRRRPHPPLWPRRRRHLLSAHDEVQLDGSAKTNIDRRGHRR